ncbi:MAG TPA: hypothetical protein VGQ83_22635 [Polyangia bacterium]|jgi:hypothetical protein
MYVTAHWVKRQDEEGINAFLHAHGGTPLPTDVGLLSRVPEETPGRLVAQRAQLPPGGNVVRAYLDVVAPDGTSVVEVRGVLDQLAEDLHERRNPTVFHRGSVLVRFGVEIGLERVRDTYYGTLSESLLELLGDELASSTQTPRARRRGSSPHAR